MKTLLFNSFLFSFLVMFGTSAFAAGAKVDAEVMNPCVATAGTNGIISQTPARATAGNSQNMKSPVLKWCLRLTHMVRTKTPKLWMRVHVQSFTVIHPNCNGCWLYSTSLGMDGESTLPPVGTYGYPYILMENQFVTNTTFTAGDGTKWYGLANGQTDQVGPAADKTDVLANFDDTTCFSGYVGAAVTGAVIDGFITNSAKLRSAAGTADPCPNRTIWLGF